MRLPLLIGHFLHHNDHHKPIDLTDFLTEHYSETEHHDSDNEEHEHLPFHHHSDDCTTHHIQLAFLNVKNFCIQPILTGSKSKNSTYNANFASQFLASIWQPPQLS